METLKWTYRILRSVILTSIIVVAALFAIVFITLSLPPIQKEIKEITANELSTFLGSKVSIGSLSIVPLNEVIINDAVIYDLDSEECLNIGRLGAGINVWRLIFRQKIEITHIELLDFKGSIYQKSEKGPLNIDFIIKAFQPKDPNKPPTRFDLKIHNIVVRGGDITFQKRWKKRNDANIFDANYIDIENFCADVTIPRLSNDYSEIDLRRLSFNEKHGFQVKETGAFIKLLPESIEIRNFHLHLPQSEINLADLTIPKTFLANDGNESDSESLDIKITDSKITPSNISALIPALSSLDFTLPLSAEIRGDPRYVTVPQFSLGSDQNLKITASGSVSNLLEKGNLEVEASNVELQVSQYTYDLITRTFPEIKKSETVARLLNALGYTDIRIRGKYEEKTGQVNLISEVNTSPVSLNISADGVMLPRGFKGRLTTEITNLDFGQIMPGVALDYLTDTSLRFDGNIDYRNIEQTNGIAELNIGSIAIANRNLAGIEASINKTGNLFELKASLDDRNIEGTVSANVLLDKENTTWDIEADLLDFDTFNSLLTERNEEGYEMKGKISLHATGNSPDNVNGVLKINDFLIEKGNGKILNLDNLSLIVSNNPEGTNRINLESDMLDVDFQGDYKLSSLVGTIRETLGEINPIIFTPYLEANEFGNANFDIKVKNANPIIEFFDVPVTPLTELNISGLIDSRENQISVRTQIPYIQQGKNKLITDTYLDVDIKGAMASILIKAGTTYPTKKGLLKLDLDITGENGEYLVDIGMNRGKDVAFFGEIPIKVTVEKDPEEGKLGLIAKWLPGELNVNNDVWHVEESEMIFNGTGLYIDDFCIRHDNQFLFISGSNTVEGEGDISVTLSDINLDSIFETLNINHVTFGGNATGGVMAREIFSGNPIIHTEGLTVRSLSYNGAVIGDGDCYGRLDWPKKMIEIKAKVREAGRLVADVDGGVWFGKDSLAFNFEADSVRIGFMQPFMAAFSSDVQGRASGSALMYGTFSDIDMVGKIVAHDAKIKIDYINAYYTASDTVTLKPGLIEIPGITVYDQYGNTALLSGELTHRYFHEPAFRFSIRDMHHLLVYNTNAMINPLWYGKIFASGVGEIVGKPGSVTIAADVETGDDSDFTFVLSDQQEAVKSHFLTFSDRRKEAALKALPQDTVPDFLKKFHLAQKTTTEESDIYSMEFRVSVTPGIKLNLVMDPVGGDKITAFGSGAMTLAYTSLTDELKIYGKYILDKGNYNFTLQDIILKDFTIKPGSSIAFTGDPYSGILDITAAYRVNTSLTELDSSFANDRELNRTNVPVEALLKVTGPLTSPNIGFDLELPTVTEETARKVKSIISTDDMMSRQVLFLVALNKFYPPEYMTTSNSGGEWASIASSTISSQIQNMIGQITDKLTIAPSIRSDKGDFSDIEFDLALSSQLFNNRLLLNGNLGYRDPNNSSTTFVGDFDAEYLLNKKGTWRLKAYNHFNDQNYYLKSALTTQGLGLVWRKEFGRPKTSKPHKEENPVDEEKPGEDPGQIEKNISVTSKEEEQIPITEGLTP